jgi:hypothetical protein
MLLTAGLQEVQRKVEEAAAAARAEAEAEAEENLNDLLACLGQEERRTERWSYPPYTTNKAESTPAGPMLCAIDRGHVLDRTVIGCRLSARLQELGEDVDALLEEVMAEEDGDGTDADEQDLTWRFLYQSGFNRFVTSRPSRCSL